MTINIWIHECVQGETSWKWGNQLEKNYNEADMLYSACYSKAKQIDPHIK